MVLDSCGDKYYRTNVISAVPTSLLIAPSNVIIHGIGWVFLPSARQQSCRRKPGKTYLTPLLPPDPSFSEFPEYLDDTLNDMNDMNWHEWHELTWITWMTWIDMNDMNWNKWHKIKRIYMNLLNDMNRHDGHEFAQTSWNDMDLHELYEFARMTWICTNDMNWHGELHDFVTKEDIMCWDWFHLHDLAMKADGTVGASTCFSHWSRINQVIWRSSLDARAFKGRLHAAFSMCVSMSDKPFDAAACDIGGQASATNGWSDMKTHIENAHQKRTV
jgi:hypothetical protein